MKREEAIALLNEQYETCKRIYDCSADQRKSYPNVPQFMEALGMALSALHPVSRERVEKVWRGEWIHDINNRYGCSKCMARETMSHKNLKPYCPNCGAPMTDEAVQMVMKRMEAINNA